MTNYSECSYLPGKSNVQLRAGIVGFTVLFAVSVGASVEQWSLQSPARYLTIVALLLATALLAIRRTAAFANSPYNHIQFEDQAVTGIHALDLHRDLVYANDGG